MREITPALERVGRFRAELGESPFWNAADGTVCWVDIPGRRLVETSPANGAEALHDFPEQTGFVLPCDDAMMLVGQENSIERFDPVRRTMDRLTEIEPDDPTTRTNDAACDPWGRLIAGTMQMAAPGAAPAPIGVLRQFSAGAPVRILDTEISIINGLAFSPGGDVIYWADTPRRIIWQASYGGATGEVGPKRPFVELSAEEGRPDGAAVDAHGCYWIAASRGFRLLRYTPQGRLDLCVHLPIERPTKLAFGGADLKTIFITTASSDLTGSDPQPLAGHLLAFDIGIAGLPQPAYRTGSAAERPSEARTQ
jgi:L-arabinonolactonase